MAGRLLERVKLYDKIAMNQGVVLDFPLFEGTGNIIHDVSKYHSNGFITGAAWAAGLHGHALDFDPTIPSYVEIPAAYTQLNFTSEDFSIIARLNFRSFLTVQRLVHRGSYQVDGYFLVYHTTVGIAFYTHQLAQTQYSSTGKPGWATGTWYTLGMSRSGASVKLYRNGVDVTLTSETHVNPTTSSRHCMLGIDDDGVSLPFNGPMEFLRIFGGVALSDSEHLAWHHKLA